MIFTAIKARAMPILYTAIGLLILSLSVAVWWLYRDNQSLSGQAERLEEQAEQLADVNSSQAAENDQLHEELKRRDRIALEASQARDRYASQARKAEEELSHALENSECAAQPHPVAVGDWLRKHSDDL